MNVEGVTAVTSQEIGSATNGFISFRSAFEKESHEKRLSCPQDEALSVGEAKVLIAKELGLEREFARKFDLRLIRVTADGTKQNLDKDEEWILPGSSLIVQRILWRPIDELTFDARINNDEKEERDDGLSAVADDNNASVGQHTLLPSAANALNNASAMPQATVATPAVSMPAKKLPLPQRFRCALCHHLLNDPVMGKCTSPSKCVFSVCKACSEVLLPQDAAGDKANGKAKCPTCSQEDALDSFVPNRSLAAMITRLDLSLYDVSSGDSAKFVSGSDGPRQNNQSQTASSMSSLKGKNSQKSGDVIDTNGAASNVTGYLIFVRPQQMSLAHASGVIVASFNKDDKNQDFISTLRRKSSDVELFLLSHGGGGTSITAAGWGIVKKAVLCTLRNGIIALADDEDLPPAAEETIFCADEVSFEEARQYIDKWNYTATSEELIVVCFIEWAIKFQSIVLLPGKAQPIAGIRNAAVGSKTAMNAAASTEVIKIASTQKQQVTQRLRNEASFSKVPICSSAHEMTTKLLERKEKEESVMIASHGEGSLLPPEHSLTPQIRIKEKMEPGSFVGNASPTSANEERSVGQANNSLGKNNFVFNPQTNAWVEVKNQQQTSLINSMTNKKGMRTAATRARLRIYTDNTFKPETSLFASTVETHGCWKETNPFLPLAGRSDFLSREAFQVLQKLQFRSTKILVERGEIQPELLSNGQKEWTPELLKAASEAAAMNPAAGTAAQSGRSGKRQQSGKRNMNKRIGTRPLSADNPRLMTSVPPALLSGANRAPVAPYNLFPPQQQPPRTCPPLFAEATAYKGGSHDEMVRPPPQPFQGGAMLHTPHGYPVVEEDFFDQRRQQQQGLHHRGFPSRAYDDLALANARFLQVTSEANSHHPGIDLATAAAYLTPQRYPPNSNVILRQGRAFLTMSRDGERLVAPRGDLATSQEWAMPLDVAIAAHSRHPITLLRRPSDRPTYLGDARYADISTIGLDQTIQHERKHLSPPPDFRERARDYLVMRMKTDRDTLRERGREAEDRARTERERERERERIRDRDRERVEEERERERAKQQTREKERERERDSETKRKETERRQEASTENTSRNQRRQISRQRLMTNKTLEESVPDRRHWQPGEERRVLREVVKEKNTSFTKNTAGAEDRSNLLRLTKKCRTSAAASDPSKGAARLFSASLPAGAGVHQTSSRSEKSLSKEERARREAKFGSKSTKDTILTPDHGDRDQRPASSSAGGTVGVRSSPKTGSGRKRPRNSLFS